MFFLFVNQAPSITSNFDNAARIYLYPRVYKAVFSDFGLLVRPCNSSASASASASVQCRAFYSVVHRERDLVALAKEGFEALNCLCMHDRRF